MLLGPARKTKKNASFEQTINKSSQPSTSRFAWAHGSLMYLPHWMTWREPLWISSALDVQVRTLTGSYLILCWYMEVSSGAELHNFANPHCRLAKLTVWICDETTYNVTGATRHARLLVWLQQLLGQRVEKEGSTGDPSWIEHRCVK